MKPSSPSSAWNNTRFINADKSKLNYRRSSSPIDSHNLKLNEIKDENILKRITWFDARLALNELYNKNLIVNKTSIRIKSRIQSSLYDLGSLIQHNAGLILFAGILIFLTTSIGIKSINYENNFENLWVEESGRVEQELNFIKKTLGEGISTTNQILLQTPFNKNINILNTKSLLMHLELMQLATSVTVDLFDMTWKLKDICYTFTTPDTEEYNINVYQTIDKMLPCLIVTPLDCFWEGSKLLGPDDDFKLPGLDNNFNMKWINFNPKQFVTNLQDNESFMRQTKTRSLTQNFLDIFKRGGITSGYQEKYCLNPLDEECPVTAPNKNHRNLSSVDVAAVLTGGCYGFARKWLHWPEKLILGAIVKNKQGKIVEAGSLQSIIQLMSDENLYEYHQNSYKVFTVQWTREKAKLVLEAWQKKLLEEVKKFNSEDNQPIKDNNFYQFTSISLIEVIKNFNYIHLNRLGLTIGLVTVYTIFNYLISKDQFRVHLITQLAGILLIVISFVSGFGLCALIGLTFNANSMQIIPYLAFGFSVNLLEQLKSTYEQNLKLIGLNNFDLISRCLQQIGYSLLVTALLIIASFLSSAIIPIPVLRISIIQTIILIACSFLSIFILYSAILSFDARRFNRSESNENCSRYDRCCLNDSKLSKLSEEALNSKLDQEKFLNNSRKEDKQLLESFYSFFLKKQIKFLVLSIYIGFTVYCVLGCLKVENGLNLTDIVPKNTDEYEFLAIQKQQYNLYNMFLITKGNFDYPNNQKLLMDYYKAFNRIQNIVKDENAGLSDFWLISFREWLKNLQNAFDQDYKSNCLNEETWFKNASTEAILAFKLLSQRNDNSIERRIPLRKRKLVDDNDIINPRAFYNYLTAWVSNDALTYSASHVVFKPEPKQWINDPEEKTNLKIPKSQPLIYTQISFLLAGLDSTEKILKTIDEIRGICDKFAKKGLNSFPTGLPFIFWEQFVNLKIFLAAGAFLICSTVFLISFFTFFNIWPSVLIVLCLIISKVQLLGLMGHLNLNLNSIPAAVLIISAGLTGSNLVCFMIHYLTCLDGSKDRRVQMTVSKLVPRTLHGLNLFVLSLVAFYWSEFNYILNYFFILLLASNAIDHLQTLVFYPIILSIIGPNSELKSTELINQTIVLNKKKLMNNKRFLQQQIQQQANHRYSSCSSTCHSASSSPSPSISSQDSPTKLKDKEDKKVDDNSYFRKVFPRMKTAISLSTISEESHDIDSKEIVFQTKLLFNSSKGSRTSLNNQDVMCDNEFRSPSVESDFGKDIETPSSLNSERSESRTSISSSFYHPNQLPQYRNLPTPTGYQEIPRENLVSPPPSYNQEEINDPSSLGNRLNQPPQAGLANSSLHPPYHPYLAVNNTFNINF